MLPRKKLDIGWSDLLAAGVYCVSPLDGARVRTRVESHATGPSSAETLACLSVRTGFDLLLSALAFPAGSEIVLSAVTIGDMVRIVEAHGLVPVPVDVDMETLAVDPISLEQVIGPRTRAVVIAHLFGSRMPLESIADVCGRHGLLLVEDCAQAYVGGSYEGNPRADVRMFSFGPIKTNTALGGALLIFRDPGLMATVRALETRLPDQRRSEFLGRTLKYLLIKALLLRPIFTLFVVLYRTLGRSYDDAINGAARGFAGPDFFIRIRRRPSAPQLALLHRRLTRFDPGAVDSRTATANDAIQILTHLRRPGERAEVHSHWVFPVRVRDPEQLSKRLASVGIDATRGASSLGVVHAPMGRPDCTPWQAAATMGEVLYLPIYPGMSSRDLAKLTAEVSAYVGGEPCKPS